MKYRVLKPLRYGRTVQPVGAEIEPDAAEAAALLRAGLIRPVPVAPSRKREAPTLRGEL
jgi:hypothetical protein